MNVPNLGRCAKNPKMALAQSIGSPPPPPPLSFSHFGILARDTKALSEFYVRVLGFTVTDRGDLPGNMSLVFLSRDPTEHHQIVLCSGRPDGGVNTVNQISLRADKLESLREIHRAIQREAGVTEIFPVTHGNAVSLYFKDPEGNRIECFVDAPFYCEQPQRVAVDLSKSDEEIMAMVEAHARSQPKFKTRAAWVEEMRALMAAQAANRRAAFAKL